MTTRTKVPHYVYVNINVQTVALFFIAEILGISKYQLFLLYETFGNDVFLFFTMCNKAGMFQELTDFRLRRCFIHAEKIAPILLGNSGIELGTTEIRSYQLINPHLFEKKLKIAEDQEAYCDT